MTSRRLAELSSPEAERRIGPDSILLCPVGAIEQHGPHLPLGTDLIVASTNHKGEAAKRLPALGSQGRR